MRKTKLFENRQLQLKQTH